MGTFAEQFGGPSGVLGHVVTRMLARGNAAFNTWLVQELAKTSPAPKTVVEVGSGPGVALKEMARVFPEAHIFGVDRSSVVQRSARRRNAAAIADGRISLVTGDLSTADIREPVDIVLGVHVIYFWSDPIAELRRIADVLAPGGRVCLGYQLRKDMPTPSQRNFPKAGFTLYDTDEEVTALLREAGFTATETAIFGTPARPRGRAALAVTPQPPTGTRS